MSFPNEFLAGFVPALLLAAAVLYGFYARSSRNRASSSKIKGYLDLIPDLSVEQREKVQEIRRNFLPRVSGIREDLRLLGRLRNRECVIALEALERKTGGTEPTSAGEIKRLQQTAELNCSQDPVHRHEQEAMAARLRVANGPACAEARNRLADLMAKGSAAPREQVRAQQAFVDEYCTPPVR